MTPVTRKSWEAKLDKIAAAVEAAEDPASLAALEEFRLEYLGRKGSLNELLKELKDLELEDRKALGPKAQALKDSLEARLASRKGDLETAADEASSGGGPDLTLPPFRPHRGRLHPLTQTLQDITKTLSLMGFSWTEGPQAETDHYNFGALNIPEHHPARDSHDTFYLKDIPLLMRTHTSPVQIRVMESQRPPLRIMCPGRVFRHEAVDATHSAVFHQVEGLYVDKNVSFADLKGTLDLFLRQLFGPKTRTLFRPSYYPFTEPSADVYMSCIFCDSKGCGVCKQTGWIEILGSGLVHSNVLKGVGYDPLAWSGFAFGIGVERVAMLRLGIRDIRAFYENDLRLLKQFDESIV